MPSLCDAGKQARFKAAYNAGLAKLQQYIDNPACAVSFYRRLRVSDPRNIGDMDAPWASVSYLLVTEPSPDANGDLKEREDQFGLRVA